MSGFFAKEMKEERSNKRRDRIQEMSSLPRCTHFRSIRKLRLNMCGSTGEQICTSASMFPRVFFANAIPAACQQLAASKPPQHERSDVWSVFFLDLMYFLGPAGVSQSTRCLWVFLLRAGPQGGRTRHSGGNQIDPVGELSQGCTLK